MTGSASTASAWITWRSLFRSAASLDALVDNLKSAGVPTEGVKTHPVLGKEYVVFRDPDNVQWEAFML